ncbi:hypothetical protein P7L70_26460 [Tistrella mobilis]|uniref:hypothetical protein n=1 Tax=Tistrella mobilis TaxID=171437 RepID=UPI003557F297
MTPDRFRRLLDAYGADIDRWPAPDRQAARTCLAHHPDLLVPMGRAAALDASIRRIAPAVSPDAVAAAIDAVNRRLEAPPANTRRPADHGVGRAPHQAVALGWPLAALAGAAAILLAIGLRGLPGTADGTAMMTLLFDSDLILLDGAVR